MITVADPFSIVLHDFPGADAHATEAAESRFAAVIARELGGPDAVLPAYQAFIDSNEQEGASLSKDEVRLAFKWAQAYEKARLAGFRGLGEPQEAYFEIVPF